MYFKSIQARHFRNLSHVSIDLSQRLNLFIGRNGHGKTNLLEAFYILCGFRSFRGARYKDLIEHHQTESQLASIVDVGDVFHHVKVDILKQKRHYFVDDKQPKNLPTWVSHMSVVTFCPDDLMLIKGEPELRRKFFDRLIFLINPEHLKHVLAYQKSLRARNTLIKDKFFGRDYMLLDSFDETLAQLATVIYCERKKWLSEITPLVDEEIQKITEGAHHLSIQYKTKIESENVNDNLYQLVQKREEDIKKQTTSFGIHFDDFEFYLSGHNAHQFCSQGEQRIITLAIKFAEMKLLQREKNFFPVLLLDDVAGELDEKRNSLLFELIYKTQGQVFIAGTDVPPLSLDSAFKTRLFDVFKGQVEPRL